MLILLEKYEEKIVLVNVCSGHYFQTENFFWAPDRSFLTKEKNRELVSALKVCKVTKILEFSLGGN